MITMNTLPTYRHTIWSPASRSEEGGLLNSPPSVRLSVRPSVHFVSKITQYANISVQLLVQSSVVLISKKTPLDYQGGGL